MEQIAGCGNWKIKYWEAEGGVIIAAALTCDYDAVLPDEIRGQTVIGLGPRALSIRDRKEWDSFQAKNASNGSIVRSKAGFLSETAPGSKSGPGQLQSIELSASIPDPDDKWSNRRIRSLILPSGLRIADDYSLMNCDHCSRLEFADHQIQWGVGVFMNCDSLRQIILDDYQADGDTLFYLARELTNELDVTLNYPLRQKYGERKRARLLFPEYYESFDERYNAHKLDYSIQGLGYAFHHAFRERRFIFRDYDMLWKNYRSRELDTDLAVLFAWYRLHWPVDLSEDFASDYLDYVSKHTGELIRQLIQSGQADSLHDLLQKVSPDPDLLRAAAEDARTLGRTECMSLLLARLGESKPTGRRKTFDL